jgi:hypothetical protein
MSFNFEHHSSVILAIFHSHSTVIPCSFLPHYQLLLSPVQVAYYAIVKRGQWLCGQHCRLPVRFSAREVKSNGELFIADRAPAASLVCGGYSWLRKKNRSGKIDGMGGFTIFGSTSAIAFRDRYEDQLF